MKTIAYSKFANLISLFIFLLFIPLNSHYSLAEENDIAFVCTGDVVDTFPYTESFETGGYTFTQNSNDDGDWRRNNNGTPSGSTGPNGANDGNFYMYTEGSTSGPSALGFNATAILTSPCFDFTGVGGATFNFDYHMFGAASGQISVEVSDDGGVNWNVVQVISGQQQTSETAPWITSSINLNAYVGNTVNVRFVGTTGSSFSSDMAVDNVEVTVTPVNPEINVTGLANDIVSGDITPTVDDGTDFGDITLGLSNSSTFFIENSGVLELLLTDPNPYITITGTNAGDFSITTIPTTPIAPVNGSTPFAIGFTPSAIGDRFATVSIASNDSDESPYVFDIMGTGVAPSSEINVSGLGNAIASGDIIPSVFDGTDFGFTTLSTPVSSDFVIINSGLLDLDLTDASPYINLIGTDASQFSISVIPDNTISNNGGTTQFQITYNPVSAGVHTVSVSIANNDPDANPFTFDITGEAVISFVPEIEIMGNAIEIVNGDTNPDIADATDYGTISLGTKKNVAFTINNVGSGALTLSGPPPYLTISGPNASEFSIQTEPLSSVAASASTVFQVQYNPFGIGTHSATITVSSDDSDESSYSFTITGIAVENENPLETPYYANFDTGNDNWVASNPGGGSVWTHGTNNVEVGTEGDYWYTNNYDDYASNSDTYVTSPVIDLAGYQNLSFKIDIRYDTDGDTGGDDGMNVEYSPDGGASWFLLGAYADPQVDNWYNWNNVDAISSGANGWAGLSFDIVSATKSDFIQATIDLPVELENNPVARFRVHFASDNSQNDNGVNFDNVFVLGDPIVSDDPLAGPAGVNTNLKLWLKTTEGVGGTNNADQLSAWEDQALDNNATRGDSSQQPIYYDDINENINYNPVVSFNDVIDSELKGKGGFNTQDYWVVMQSDGSIDSSSPIKGVIAGRVSRDQFSEDGTGLWINPGSLRFSGVDNIVSHMVGATSPSTSDIGDGSYGRAYTSNTDRYDDEPIILNIKVNNAGNQTEIYKNGIRIDNYTGKTTGFPSEDLPYINVTNSSYILGVGRITVGGTNYDSHFNGKMSEVISYANPLTIFDQEKIQSYLAIKYGITLHDVNSTSITRLGDQNYIDSDGSIMWNVAAHTGYNYDIAGIGRDITSGLNQKQSISVNPSAIVTMGLTEVYSTNNENIANNTNTIADKNFLMWGNDNKSLNAAASIIVDLSDDIAGLNTVVDITSVERSWKVVETGTVGRVKVSVPEIALSATLDPPGSFFMFISDTPTFNPSSEYRIMLPNGDNVEAEYDFEGTKYITFGYAPDYVFDRSITFNGTTDYMDAQDYLDIEGDFTISTWVKHSSEDYTVLSKNNPSFSEGYELKINTDKTVSMIWNNGSVQNITSGTEIPNDEWHQIAVSYNGTSASLYIDGVLDIQEPLSPPVVNTEKFLIAAGRGSNPTDFYEGTIDEVRVWDAALTASQIRFIMNQEILENTNLMVRGEVIPASISKNDIDAIPWDSLDGYFPMTTYAFTNVKGASGNTVVAAIKNLKTVDFQTAPLPYVSRADGNWADQATWENGTGFQVPNATSIVDNTVRVDWNIVQTAHNVTTQENNTVLALDVQANELSIENDSKIEVSHYLKLDGLLDLVDESQLVQTENSDLDITSAGSLEKDQQGTADTYSYNIWSSPVSTINNSQINTDYTVGGIMNDGTDMNTPTAMSFSGGFNGAPTSPITISSYWIFKYGNGIEQFQPIGSTGNVSVGEGYTMKGPGSGVITDPQNYVFVGKPNNSTDAQSIVVPAIADRDYIVGNPFPSALDANDFINDNPHLDGTLYLWEHYGGGNHIQADYQAGYALYTLSGGTPAVSHPDVSNIGSGTKTPERYVPVGQGFFVAADSDGDIVFNNSQRNFVRKTGASIFLFGEPEEEANSGQEQAVNDPDIDQQLDDSDLDAPDMREKFRIGFDSPSLYHRQLLLTVDPTTTFGIDRAYDGEIQFGPTEDMTWDMEDRKFVILGVPNVTDVSEFPLVVTLPQSGPIRIKIDALEHVDTETTTVYLKDRVQNTVTNLLESDYEITLEAGEHYNRYVIVFRKDANEEETTEEEETEQEEETEGEWEEEGEETSEEWEEEEEETTTGTGEETDTEEETDTTDTEQGEGTSGTDTEEEDTSADTDTEEETEAEEQDTDISVQEENVSLEEETDLHSLTVSFNTQGKYITITKNERNNVTNATLFSMLGQVIQQWKPETGTGTIQLPVSNISKGPYILRLETDMGSFTEKLIIY